ncbi:MAG: hypothetical protein M3Y66_06900, partial [Actinomycetota bacterium]|nr:hypothetical protein [Actinomycetota bacterium]
RPLGVPWGHGAIQAPNKGATMADKSPRQGMSKKSGKSLKEKRAEKRGKSEASDSGISSVTHKKR